MAQIFGYIRELVTQQWVHAEKSSEGYRLILSNDSPLQHQFSLDADGNLVHVSTGMCVVPSSSSHGALLLLKPEQAENSQLQFEGKNIVRKVQPNEQEAVDVLEVGKGIMELRFGVRGNCQFEYVVHNFCRPSGSHKCSHCQKKVKSHALECTVCSVAVHAECSMFVAANCHGVCLGSWLAKHSETTNPSLSSSNNVATTSTSKSTSIVNTEVGRVVCYGYIRHRASRKWLHPFLGKGYPGVLGVLHQDPPDPHQLSFFDSGAIMLNACGLFLMPQDPASPDATRLFLHSSSDLESICQFRLSSEGHWVHKESGKFVIPEKRAGADAALQLSRHPNLTASNKEDAGIFEFVVHRFTIPTVAPPMKSTCVVCQKPIEKSKYDRKRVRSCTNCYMECHERCLLDLSAACDGLSFHQLKKQHHQISQQQQQQQQQQSIPSVATTTISSSSSLSSSSSVQPLSMSTSLTETGTAIVILKVHVKVDPSQTVVVSGALAMCRYTEFLEMQPISDRRITWTIILHLPRGGEIEYKYGLVSDSSIHPSWESRATARAMEPRGVLTMIDDGALTFDRLQPCASTEVAANLKELIVLWEEESKQLTSKDVKKMDHMLLANLVVVTADVVMCMRRREAAEREKKQTQNIRKIVMGQAAEMIVMYKSYLFLPNGDDVLRMVVDLLVLCIAAADADKAGEGKDSQIDKQHEELMKKLITRAATQLCETLTAKVDSNFQEDASIYRLQSVSVPTDNGKILKELLGALKDEVAFESSKFASRPLPNTKIVSYQAEVFVELLISSIDKLCSHWGKISFASFGKDCKQLLASMVEAVNDIRVLVAAWVDDGLLPSVGEKGLNYIDGRVSTLLEPLLQLWLTEAPIFLDSCIENSISNNGLERYSGDFQYATSVIDCGHASVESGKSVLNLQFVSFCEPGAALTKYLPQADMYQGCSSHNDAAAVITANGMNQYVSRLLTISKDMCGGDMVLTDDQIKQICVVCSSISEARNRFHHIIDGILPDVESSMLPPYCTTAFQNMRQSLEEAVQVFGRGLSVVLYQYFASAISTSLSSKKEVQVVSAVKNQFGKFKSFLAKKSSSSPTATATGGSSPDATFQTPTNSNSMQLSQVIQYLDHVLELCQTALPSNMIKKLLNRLWDSISECCVDALMLSPNVGSNAMPPKGHVVNQEGCAVVTQAHSDLAELLYADGAGINQDVMKAGCQKVQAVARLHSYDETVLEGFLVDATHRESAGVSLEQVKGVLAVKQLKQFQLSSSISAALSQLK